jgi:hypothetical protein
MRILFALLILVLSVSVSCSRDVQVNSNVQNSNAIAAPSPTPETPPGTTIVMTIPEGDSGVTYADVDTEELEPWGPSSFSVAPDGTYLIVDAVTNRILRFRPDGTQLPAIQVENVAGITDVTVTDDGIFALDQKAENPALVRINNEGRTEERIDLEASSGLRSMLRREALTGISAEEDGDVFLEFKGGNASRDLNNARAVDRAFRGNRFSVRVPTLQTQVQQGGSATVLRDGQPFTEIRVENLVAELRILGVTSGGDVVVVVDEIIPTSVVTIDETVRRYRSDGTLIDMARVPLARMTSHIENNLVMKPDGNVEALVTTRPALIVRLQFAAQLEPILPRTTFTPSGPGPTAPTPCRTRAQMLATAREYWGNVTTLSVQNLEDGNCSGRGKPRYLGTAAGPYKSVPYDWGGFDSVAGYRTAMSSGWQAGDVKSCRGGCTEDCSKGVDCSGFVSRVWAATRHTTASLPNISTEVNILELKSGDIVNRPNQHVILFEAFTGSDGTGNGLRLFESTKGGFDRVINRSTNWRRWRGYTARRYRRVCAG